MAMHRPLVLAACALSPAEWTAYADWIAEYERAGHILKSLDALVAFVRDRAPLERGCAEQISAFLGLLAPSTSSLLIVLRLAAHAFVADTPLSFTHDHVFTQTSPLPSKHALPPKVQQSTNPFRRRSTSNATRISTTSEQQQQQQQPADANRAPKLPPRPKSFSQSNNNPSSSIPPPPPPRRNQNIPTRQNTSISIIASSRKPSPPPLPPKSSTVSDSFSTNSTIVPASVTQNRNALSLSTHIGPWTSLRSAPATYSSPKVFSQNTPHGASRGGKGRDNEYVVIEEGAQRQPPSQQEQSQQQAEPEQKPPSPTPSVSSSATSSPTESSSSSSSDNDEKEDVEHDALVLRQRSVKARSLNLHQPPSFDLNTYSNNNAFKRNISSSGTSSKTTTTSGDDDDGNDAADDDQDGEAEIFTSSAPVQSNIYTAPTKPSLTRAKPISSSSSASSSPLPPPPNRSSYPYQYHNRHSYNHHQTSASVSSLSNITANSLSKNTNTTPSSSSATNNSSSRRYFSYQGNIPSKPNSDITPTTSTSSTTIHHSSPKIVAPVPRRSVSLRSVEEQSKEWLSKTQKNPRKSLQNYDNNDLPPPPISNSTFIPTDKKSLMADLSTISSADHSNLH